MKTTLPALFALALALVAPRSARADEALLGASFGAASGLEIGDGGDVMTVWRLARTRAVAGIDWRNPEDPRTIVYGQLYAELDPAVSFGVEGRYGRAFGSHIEGYVGLSATLAPATLFGPLAAARYYPFGVKSEWSPFVEPSLSVMPFGTDLPSSKPIVWSLVTVGVRLDLSPPSEP
jgi:hypothetical protein